MIYSPDFPDKYAAGRVCYWTVRVPGSRAILFNFTFFEISDQTDMVELLDGYTNRVVARFDWRSPPGELVNVTGDSVIVYFYSDRTNQAQGFALLYQGRASLLRKQNVVYTFGLVPCRFHMKTFRNVLPRRHNRKSLERSVKNAPVRFHREPFHWDLDVPSRTLFF